MELREVGIAEIKTAEYNPRLDLKPNFPEYQGIARSLWKWGIVEPLVWNEETGNLVSGHQRIKMLAARGIETVLVSVVHLSAEQEKALNLALNRIEGYWEESKLSALLEELQEVGLVEETGFSSEEIEALLAEVTNFEPVLVEPEPVEVVCPRCNSAFSADLSLFPGLST